MISICYVTWTPLIRRSFVAQTLPVSSMSSFKSLLPTRHFNFTPPLIETKNIDLFITGVYNLELPSQRPYPPHSPVHSTAKLWREKPKARAATATPHRTVNKQTTRQQLQLVSKSCHLFSFCFVCSFKSFERVHSELWLPKKLFRFHSHILPLAYLIFPLKIYSLFSQYYWFSDRFFVAIQNLKLDYVTRKNDHLNRRKI